MTWTRAFGWSLFLGGVGTLVATPVFFLLLFALPKSVGRELVVTAVALPIIGGAMVLIALVWGCFILMDCRGTQVADREQVLGAAQDIATYTLVGTIALIVLSGIMLLADGSTFADRWEAIRSPANVVIALCLVPAFSFLAIRVAIWRHYRPLSWRIPHNPGS